MKTKEEELTILRRAKALIEKGWTQNTWCRDAKGNELNADSTDAVCWCLSAALGRAANDYGALYLGPLDNIIGHYYIDWNDAPERTQAQVVKALEQAIAYAEQT